MSDLRKDFEEDKDHVVATLEKLHKLRSMRNELRESQELHRESLRNEYQTKQNELNELNQTIKSVEQQIQASIIAKQEFLEAKRIKEEEKAKKARDAEVLPAGMTRSAYNAQLDDLYRGANRLHNMVEEKKKRNKEIEDEVSILTHNLMQKREEINQLESKEITLKNSVEYSETGLQKMKANCEDARNTVAQLESLMTNTMNGSMVKGPTLFEEVTKNKKNDEERTQELLQRIKNLNQIISSHKAAIETLANSTDMAGKTLSFLPKSIMDALSNLKTELDGVLVKGKKCEALYRSVDAPTALQQLHQQVISQLRVTRHQLDSQLQNYVADCGNLQILFSQLRQERCQNKDNQMIIE